MSHRLPLRRTYIPTPLGRFVVLVDSEGRLRAAYWTNHSAKLQSALEARYSSEGSEIEADGDPFRHAATINAYFEGQLDAIDSLPVECVGTDFQKAV